MFKGKKITIADSLDPEIQNKYFPPLAGIS